MRKLPHWHAALMEVVGRYAESPFVWGQTDCACFVSDCVLAMTGVDPMAEYRGAYRGRFSAARRLRGSSLAETASAALIARGATRIDTRFSAIGDLASVPGDIMAVRLAPGFVARTALGQFVVAQPIEAWSIPWHRSH